MSGWMFMLGVSLMTSLWWMNNRSQENTYTEKAMPKYRTPIRIRDRFYYIVSEKEFNEMSIAYLERHTNDPDDTCMCDKCHLADRGGI